MGSPAGLTSDTLDARSVEAVSSVSMDDFAASARSVEAVRSVSMDDFAASARSVEAVGSADL